MHSFRFRFVSLRDSFVNNFKVLPNKKFRSDFRHLPLVVDFTDFHTMVPTGFVTIFALVFVIGVIFSAVTTVFFVCLVRIVVRMLRVVGPIVVRSVVRIGVVRVGSGPVLLVFRGIYPWNVVLDDIAVRTLLRIPIAIGSVIIIVVVVENLVFVAAAVY